MLPKLLHSRITAANVRERITAKNQSPHRLLHCLLPKLTSPSVLKFRSHTLTPALESPTHLLNYSTHGRRTVPLQLRKKQKPAKRTTQSHLAQGWTETSREQMETRAVRGKCGIRKRLTAQVCDGRRKAPEGSPAGSHGGGGLSRLRTRVSHVYRTLSLGTT